MTQRSTDGLRAAASAAVSLLLMAWLWRQLQTDQVLSLLARLDWRWLGLAAALGPLQIWLAAARWRQATELVGGRLSAGRAVREVALSTLLNQLLPGGVAGDGVRAWRARSGAGDLGRAVETVVYDRWVGLLVHVAVTVLGVGAWMRLYPEVAVPVAVYSVLAVLLAALPALAWASRIGPVARTVLARAAPGQLGRSLLLTSTFLAGFSLCGLAVGQPLGGLALAVVPLVLLAMALPVSIGGWGLREASAALLLPRFGWTEEAAVAVSVAYGLSALLGATPGVLVPWWRA